MNLMISVIACRSAALMLLGWAVGAGPLKVLALGGVLMLLDLEHIIRHDQKGKP